MKRGFTVLVLFLIVACHEQRAHSVQLFQHYPRVVRQNSLSPPDTLHNFSDDVLNHYLRGLAMLEAGDEALARRHLERAVRREKSFTGARLALAGLLLGRGERAAALREYDLAVRYDPTNVLAYRCRAAAHEAAQQYSQALDDLTVAIRLEPESGDLYTARGRLYQQAGMYREAADDLTGALERGGPAAEIYMMRAGSYDEMGEADRAAADYAAVVVLTGNSREEQLMRARAEERLYAFNREEESPEIILHEPLPTADGAIEVRPSAKSVVVSGSVTDRSPIAALMVNNIPLRHSGSSSVAFEAELPIGESDTLNIIARDIYDNERAVAYLIRRTEADPPVIELSGACLHDDGTLIAGQGVTTINIEGVIYDESPIRSVRVGSISAQFSVDELNPSFIAREVDVRNRNSITIEVEDLCGNITLNSYGITRTGTLISDNNPMGNTLVIFIENSDYEDFVSLQGPPRDASLITTVLEDEYEVLPVRRLRNQTKEQMERFFAIELRDEIRKREVRSLVIWFAGHGKFINEVGYWVPVDARRDDEFSYFSLNSLRASMESYTDHLKHLLVITDACESGAGFYQSMRSQPLQRDCADWQATELRSSQVFSSAGHHYADDDSQFTRTFASVLRANRNRCIPVDEIVMHVTRAVTLNSRQKPLFGKIRGLKDEDGTFFFIKK